MSDSKSRAWMQTPLWVRIALVVFVLDLGTFYLGSVIIGGDAARGYHRSGKYFLNNRQGGVEVSRALYYYSNIHLFSVFASLALLAYGLRRVPSRPDETKPV